MNATQRKAAEAKAKAANNEASETEPKQEPKAVKLCGCGCGEQVARSFKPGHDARLHGQVVRALKVETDEAKRAILLATLAEHKWDVPKPKQIDPEKLAERIERLTKQLAEAQAQLVS